MADQNHIYHWLTLAIVATLPGYLLRFTLLGIPTNLLEISILTLTLIGLSDPAIRQNWKISWSSIPGSLKVTIFLFITSTLVSTFVGSSLHSLGQLKSLIIVPIIIAFQGYSLGKKTQRKIITALLFSGAFISLLGLSQLGHLDRISSLFDVPNSLALFLTPLIIIAIWQPRKLFQLLSIVMLIALVATQSISALAALGITMLIGFFAFRKKALNKNQLKYLIVTTLFTAVFLFNTDRLSYFLHNPQTTSLDVRQQLWSVSLDLIKANPVFGIGLGQFEPAYQQKLHQRFSVNQQPIPEFVFRDPHSWPLSFYLNLGLLGLLSFSYLNFYLIKNSTQSVLTLALIAMLIHGLADTVYWKNDLAVLYWIIVALLISSPLSLPAELEGEGEAGRR